MTPKTFMLIAGEASGDQLAAELVAALRARHPGARFFGAGGPKMAAAGVELAVDMTQYAVTGVTGILKNLFKIWRIRNQLLALASERRPDVIIGVDYGEFNARFAHAVKNRVRKNPGGWNPKIVKFISPQVWASRPGRAKQLAADCDLLLSIFPFEKDWYAQRVPQLRVEFIGHPMVDRFASEVLPVRAVKVSEAPDILLLPGSRRGELKHHLPAMIDAATMIVAKLPKTSFTLVLPNNHFIENLWWQFARKNGMKYRLAGPPTIKDVEASASKFGLNLKVQIGDLPKALAQADLAISKTGTVTMECAFFRVPAVTLYKGSWLDYQIAKRLITVTTFTMPNLLAGETVYPEFLQYDLTSENLARAALELLQDPARREQMKAQLDKVVTSLGEPGGAGRAADAILSLFP